MKLYFVRHGQTEFNHIGRIQGGRIDSPLTQKGIEGAKKVGKRLSEIKFNQVYVSPLQRAKDTASFIMAENKDSDQPAIIEETNFRELQFGQWEGQLITDIEGERQYVNLKTRPEKYDPSQHQGESYQQLVERSRHALNKIISHHSEAANLLIVSHGITLTTLLKDLEGKELSAYRESGLLDNTSISIMETDDEGLNFTLIAYNS
ncbi:histidine phosphatase family protein [Vagococcus sp. BWB3-3]|uniref:Histidine phosphatase family protein n=1 Tax=Vagococcus allomyrinae TaxID=2794353 RepID=A0A940PD76_9ENTE|nr:histidine phosphatase family protein [Vagococcus allomyrinae]MBP1041361.1 histidine phosphatase family protein [Vagococcus allomyrinae]